MSPPSRPTPATAPTATTRFAPLTTSLPSRSLPRSRPCGPAPPWAPQCSHEGLKEEPPPRSELSSSLGSFSHRGTLGGRSGRVSKDPTAQEAKLHPEEELESFFGQLWAVPSPPRRHPPRVSPEGLLFWVRKDLVRERRITIQECFPVRKSDRLDSKPIQLSFSRDIWGGPNCKDTYADVVKKRKMAEERGRWVWQPDPPQRPVRQLRQDPPGRPQQQHQTHPPPPNRPQAQAHGARLHPGPPPPPPPGRQHQVPQQSRPPQRFQRKPQKIQQQGGMLWMLLPQSMLDIVP